MAKSDARIYEFDGLEVRLSNPEKVYFPAAGVNQAKLRRISYVGCAQAVLQPPTRADPQFSSATPGGYRERALLPECVPAKPPGMAPDGRSEVPLRAHGGRAGLRSTPRISAWGGDPRQCRLQPVAGAAHPDLDHPDELRVDLDPSPSAPGTQSARVAVARATCSTIHGLRGYPKTSRIARDPHHVRVEQSRRFADVRRAALRARARGRAPDAGPRDQQVVEGGAPRRLRRLQPEREGPHRRLRVLGAAGRRRPRINTASLGRGRRRRARANCGSTRSRAGCRRSAILRPTWMPTSARSSRCSRWRTSTSMSGVSRTRRGRPTSPSSLASPSASSPRGPGRRGAGFHRAMWRDVPRLRNQESSSGVHLVDLAVGGKLVVAPTQDLGSVADAPVARRGRSEPRRPAPGAAPPTRDRGPRSSGSAPRFPRCRSRTAPARRRARACAWQ